MSFVSFEFLIFFVLLSSVYFLEQKFFFRKFLNQLILFIAGILFYSFAGIKFLPFLLFSCVSSWLLAFLVRKSRALFFASVALELLPLIFFKYINSVLSLFLERRFTFVLPLGISFFTFQSLGYLLDVRRGNIEPEKNLLTVSLFVSFFPTVSSGPIQRAENLIPQFSRINAFDYGNATDGMKLFAWGFLKKFIVADSISVYVNSVYSSPLQIYGCAVLLATLFYSFQIYFDFSGYSDMAIGISRFLGFDIGKNFDHPYLSKGCSEFWRKWHVSLSSWLRDYIYIPLGGSRCSLPRVCLNLMLTFLASGIWHGASFSFVIWGALHGLYVCLERIFRKRLEKIPSLLRIFGTFLLVSFAWIFFRAENVHDSFMLIKKLFYIPYEIFRTFPALTSSFGIKESVRQLFALSDEVKGLTGIIFIFLKILPVAAIELFTYKKSGLEIIRSQKTAVRWFLYSVFVLFVLLNIPQSRSTSFLYFNF